MTPAADHTQAVGRQRSTALSGGSGSTTSLALTVLGMLIAAAAVAATTVRSWSRAGHAAPPARASGYHGRRRR